MWASHTDESLLWHAEQELKILENFEFQSQRAFDAIERMQMNLLCDTQRLTVQSAMAEVEKRGLRLPQRAETGVMAAK